MPADGRELFMDHACVMIQLFIKKTFCVIHVIQRKDTVFGHQIFTGHAANTVGEVFAEIVQLIYVDFLHGFVAVDHKDPVVGGLPKGKISGGGEIVTPCKIKQFIRISGGDFLRPVCGTRVYDHNFKSAGLDGFQALLDARFFIFGDDAYRYGMHGRLL